MSIGGSNRIAFQWSSDTAGLTYSVLFAANGGADFVVQASGINGQSTQLQRGAAWRLDFPSALARVRGCDADGNCIDSNEQPLLDALLGSVVKLPNADCVADFSRDLTVSRNGNTLVVMGARVGTSIGPAAHLHLFERDTQGHCQRQQVLEPAWPSPSSERRVSTAPAPRWSLPSYPRRPVLKPPSRSSRAWARSGSGRPALPTSRPASTLGAVLVAEASNGLFARFGTPRLSGDGAVLAVQGIREIPDPQDPIATPAVPDAFVALFTREATSGWIARITVRSTKPQDCCALREDNDQFAASLALDDDGTTLAVGAPGDNSDPSDTVGDPGNHARPNSGAVWIFRRTGEAVWSRQAFVKAPGGTGPDFFGSSVALARDGRVLAATALGQSVPAGVNRSQAADRLAVIRPVDQFVLNSEVRPTCLRPTTAASGRSERRRSRRSSRAPA